MEHYRPRLRYLLIDEGRYSDSELKPLRNLVAALFRLESSRGRRDVDEVLATLVERLEGPEQRELNRALAVWVGKVILGRLPGPPVGGLDDLQEMRKMLADRIEEWGEEFKREGLRKGLEEGRERGLEEGRERGLQEGESRLLLRQLCKRFGKLPDWVSSRVQQATPEQLEVWGERLLEIDSLTRLFDPE